MSKKILTASVSALIVASFFFFGTGRRASGASGPPGSKASLQGRVAGILGEYLEATGQDSSEFAAALRELSPKTVLERFAPEKIQAPEDPAQKLQWYEISNAEWIVRNKIARLVAIEDVNLDENKVAVLCTAREIEAVRALQKKHPIAISRMISPADFPPRDAVYHNYQETLAFLQDLQAANPNLISVFSIGQTHEKRQIQAIRFNTTEKGSAPSQKPGIVFMGTHHSREHLSTEVPLLLAKHLAEAYRAAGKDSEFARLLEQRDITIIPLVNPDGSEYDIATGSYRWWRKNRKINGDGNIGVDLNRNYGFHWGEGGASDQTSSDIYKGPAGFSEPESSAVRDFVSAKTNVKVLLSYHTFSELILYPWGHSNSPVDNPKDRETFKKLAETMAQWNGYTPEQSSDLYIASGDTTDWAYGEKGIFAFTFELSPKDMWGGGGFYPGAEAVAKTFQANLKPALYLIEVADNPYKVLGSPAD
ncbi:MAG: zinc carboxypeptidase [Elusimicrobia bacterium]|nr:zinc carboxypeptidase [Elusimicrobiota bacterium]